MKRDPADWPFPLAVWTSEPAPRGLVGILANPDMSRRCDRIVHRVAWAIIALAAGVVVAAVLGALR